MHLLFIADPLESFKIYKDSTFAMMQEAQSRGHRLSVCEPKDLTWQRGQSVTAFVRDIVRRQPGDVLAKQTNAALIGWVKARDGVGHGRLATAVWSNQSEDFARMDLHVHAAECNEASKTAHDPSTVEGGRAFD